MKELPGYPGDPGQSCVHLFARILSTSFSTGPVQQKDCRCECSWSHGRERRRLVSAVGAAQQQHPSLSEGLENGLATRGGERRGGKDVRLGPQ